MNDAEIIEKYLLVINKNADNFSSIELKLFKIGGLAPSRRIIFREAYEQNIILRFEYESLIAWEDRFANGEYGDLIRSQLSNSKYSEHIITTALSDSNEYFDPKKRHKKRPTSSAFPTFISNNEGEK